MSSCSGKEFCRRLIGVKRDLSYRTACGVTVLASCSLFPGSTVAR